MAYSGRIYREQGGSVMTFASGASLHGGSGAKIDFSAGRAIFGTLEGNTTFSGAVTVSSSLGVGVAATAACFASSKVKLGIDIAASGTAEGSWEVLDFGNGIKFFLVRSLDAPSAAGSPGSLLLRLPGAAAGQGSAAALYIKKGDNQPASAGWTIFMTGTSDV